MSRYPAQRELRIEELAGLTNTTVRNIRVYQEKGLLPPPSRRGRTAWYSPEHLSRLQRITSLLERGYTFATIEELFTAEHFGLSVGEMIDASSAEDMRRLPNRRKAPSIEELRRAIDLDIDPEFLRLGHTCGLLTLDDSGALVDIDASSVRLLSLLAELGLDITDLGELLARSQALAREAVAASSELVDRAMAERDEAPPYPRTREDIEVIAAVGSKLLGRMCVHMVSEMLDERLER